MKLNKNIFLVGIIFLTFICCDSPYSENNKDSYNKSIKQDCDSLINLKTLVSKLNKDSKIIWIEMENKISSENNKGNHDSISHLYKETTLQLKYYFFEEFSWDTNNTNHEIITIDDKKYLLDNLINEENKILPYPIRTGGNMLSKAFSLNNVNYLVISVNDFTNPSYPSDNFILIFIKNKDDEYEFKNLLISSIPSVELISDSDDNSEIDFIMKEESSSDTCWLYNFSPVENQFTKSNWYLIYDWYPDKNNTLNEYFNISIGKWPSKLCEN